MYQKTLPFFKLLGIDCISHLFEYILSIFTFIFKSYKCMYLEVELNTALALACVSVNGNDIKAFLSLREHAYSNILKISTPKTENFQIKNSDIFSARRF